MFTFPGSMGKFKKSSLVIDLIVPTVSTLTLVVEFQQLIVEISLLRHGLTLMLQLDK
jgi:hypothetical protein